MRASSFRDLATWALVLTALAASACGPAVVPTGTCAVASDCADDELCVNDRCVPDERADGGGGLVIGDGDGDGDGDACTLDDEATVCGPSRYCIDGTCAILPGCGPNGECPDGLVCNTIEGLCVRAAGCDEGACGCELAACDDGAFCNGAEACVEGAGCVPGVPPCAAPTPLCDESGDRCVACLSPADCGGAACVDGVCACVPQCGGRECGPDGCGGSCGSCAPGDVCAENGQCGCTPSCAGRECGSDGCGGTCGSCDPGDACSDDGQCGCVPSCAGKECGSDGCGGSCGGCEANETCASGTCVCAPQCTGKECGPDGCGGTCGGCEANETCSNGTCTCVPFCTGKECGSDGCGGTCGTCASYELCDGTGTCVIDGVVCDYLLDGATVDAFDAVGGTLDGADERFVFDGRPERVIDNYGVTATKESTITVSLTSTAFDAYLYLYRVDGQCTLVTKNDDVVVGDSDSELSYTIADTGSYEILVTSFFGNETGAYTVSSTAELCGLTIDATTYAKCAPVIAAQATPCQNNPCLPDNPVPTDEFCCVNASCRSGYGTGETIQTFSTTLCQ